MVATRDWFDKYESATFYKTNISANMYDIASCITTVVEPIEMLQVDLIQLKQSCLDSKPCNDQIVF